MANNKFYGYTPKYAKGNVGVPHGEDLKFVNQNPYEFRKGMDYELTSLGCSRLQESTPEEREKATETVLKNLEEHQAYYSALMQFETGMNHAGQIEGKNFKSWLNDHFDQNKMKEIKNVWKFGKMEDVDHKNDKMTEPKTTTKEENIKAHIKESIKNKIRKSLLEWNEAEGDNGEEDEDVTAKKASKGAKKAERGLARFDNEKIEIDKILFGDPKPKRGEEVEEYTLDNPHDKSLIGIKNQHIEVYKNSEKDAEDVAKYKEAMTLPEKELKRLEKYVEKYSEKGNNVTINDVKGKDIPDTIKKLQLRKTAIDKEIQDYTSELGRQKAEIAITDMTRENYLRLLEIIRENGISLREGTDSIRPYYKIAKSSYLEGLVDGLRL